MEFNAIRSFHFDSHRETFDQIMHAVETCCWTLLCREL